MRKKDLPPTKHDIPFKYPLIFLFTAFIFGLILFAVDKYNDTNEVYGFSVKEPTVPAMQEKIAAPPTELVVTEPGAEFSSNEILIKVKENAKSKIKQNNNPLDTGIAALDDLNKKNNVKKFERVAKPGKNSDQENALFRWYKITLDEPQEIIEEKDELKAPKVKSLLYEYKKDPDIEAVEPNYIFHTVLEPNDPYYLSSSIWHTYPDLWGMHKINASVAWDQTTGSSAIVVADIDTGVDRNHPDLAANIWTNPGELPNNGIDDDKNGYIDDYYGWNFVKNTGDPMDDHGHGTHTAGTIAAVGNNAIGVVGVNWQAKIMVLKFLDSGGSGSLDSGIKALQYAADMGARVSSNSWGCECNSVAMDDAVKYEHDKGMVMVAAAGNDNSDAAAQNRAGRTCLEIVFDSLCKHTVKHTRHFLAARDGHKIFRSVINQLLAGKFVSALFIVNYSACRFEPFQLCLALYRLEIVYINLTGIDCDSLPIAFIDNRHISDMDSAAFFAGRSDVHRICVPDKLCKSFDQCVAGFVQCFLSGRPGGIFSGIAVLDFAPARSDYILRSPVVIDSFGFESYMTQFCFVERPYRLKPNVRPKNRYM